MQRAVVALLSLLRPLAGRTPLTHEQVLGDRANGAASCVTADPTWHNASKAARASSRRPRALLFDVGVEIGQSALLALGLPPKQACVHAWHTPDFKPPNDARARQLDSWQKVCVKQSKLAERVLQPVIQDARERFGIDDLLNKTRVYMVEPSSDYAPVLAAIQARFPSRVHAFPRVAITPGLDGLGHASKFNLAVIGKHCHLSRCGANLTLSAGTLNLNRLLGAHARVDDFVVLKVDVEAREYALIPCLAASPAAALVDHLLLERHDAAADAVPERLDAALSQLRAKGVRIQENWP